MKKETNKEKSGVCAQKELALKKVLVVKNLTEDQTSNASQQGLVLKSHGGFTNERVSWSEF